MADDNLVEKASPSDLATDISLYLENTTDHAEAIDRIIEAHSRVVCSYCGDATVEQMAVVGGVWTTDARELMQAHLLACPKRPERKLVDLVDALMEALRDVAANTVADGDCWCASNGEHADYCLKASSAIAQVEELKGETSS